MAHGGAARVVLRRRDARRRSRARAARRDRVPAAELVDLGELHATTGCLDEVHQLYLARIDAVGAPDKHEAIEEIKVLPVATVERLIADGQITDGPTLALFLRARLRGLL